jgi:uncharacterized protein YfiM (DUF2279 family)
MESGFENIPEGSKVQTKLTDTGERVHGNAYPSLSQVSTQQSPLSAAPKPPARHPVTEAVGSFGAGTQAAITFPFDMLGAAVGAEKPVMGKEWLREKTGGWQPQGALGRASEGAGEVFGTAVLGPAAQSARTGNALMKGIKAVTPSAIGSATGTAIARGAELGPAAELGLSLAGGILPSARTLGGSILGPTADKLSRTTFDVPIAGEVGPFTGLAKALTPSDEFIKRAQFNYEKAVRPSVSGKTRASDYQKYMDKATSAMEEIVQQARKAGKPVPDDLKSFATAIEDARMTIYPQYNSMAKQAGSAGATVDINPIIRDLEKIRSSKAIKDFGGNAVKHIDDLIDTIGTRQQYTPEEAEEAIKLLNQKLSGYYGGRSSGLNEVTASIDDTVARFLRLSLDDAVDKYNGPGYQQLKNRYGALRTIEKDVVNRAIVDGRKNNVGLLDFSDMFSVSKGVYSAAKLDPAGAAAAGAMYALKQNMKKRNDPNLLVKKLFKDLDKNLPPREQWTGIPGPEERFTMKPYEGPVTNERGLVPTGRTRNQTVDADYTTVTPVGMTPRAGLLESPRAPGVVNAPRNPANRPGGIAGRTVTSGPTVQEAAPIDFNSALRSLTASGMSPVEARDMLIKQLPLGERNKLLQQIKAEMLQRSKN